MTAKEKFYRAYMEFLETAERKRRWNIFEDVPWDKLAPGANSEERALRIETYCAEEMYLPDYTGVGNEMLRGVFGLAWFQNAWSYEESRHGLVFREYLIRSGLRTQAQFDNFESDVFSRSWKAPFATRRRMTCYGALQESATYLAYRAQKGSRGTGEGRAARSDFLSGQPRRGCARRILPRDDRDRDGRGPARYAGGPRARDRELQDAGRGPDTELSRESSNRRRRNQSACVPDTRCVSATQAVGHQPRRAQARDRCSTSAARGLAAFVL